LDASAHKVTCSVCGTELIVRIQPNTVIQAEPCSKCMLNSYRHGFTACTTAWLEVNDPDPEYPGTKKSPGKVTT
jgi:hypothetical protein